MLWCVELRSPDPYCPIDLSYDGGEIVVSEAESIDRPLRLGVDEASALLVALRMLAELPGIGDRLGAEPHHRQAGGRGRDAPARPAPRSPSRSTRGPRTRRCPGHRGAEQRAGGCTSPTTCRAGTRPPSATSTPCGWSWWTAAATWRAGAAGPRRSGCSGWTGCWTCEVLDVPAEVPPEAEPVDVDEGLFRPSPRDVRVVLELSTAGRWVAEYYPCDEVAELPDGRLRVQPAHAGHPVGAPPGPAAGRGRQGDRAARRGGPDRRRRRGRAGPVCITIRYTRFIPRSPLICRPDSQSGFYGCRV